MSTSTAQSPTTFLTGQITCKISPSDQTLRSNLKTPETRTNRCRNISVHASLDGDTNGHNTIGGKNKHARALELQRILEEVPYEIVSRDSHPLPRPLSNVSNTVSDGSRLRVAYQGVRGAYSESAAEKAYPNCEAVPCEQFDTAFSAVERWLVDRAVLPIENSLGGSIHRNYDLLLKHSLHIVGEVKLSIRHCLLANHGVQVEELKRVLSHPQALAQCENTLTRMGLVREAVDDTAGAAKLIAFHKLKDTGAVASSTAARIYNLNIIAQDIQDDSDNVTRFLMLAREPIIPGTDRLFKTSIVFSLEEGPGVLFKALAVFALRQINLTKIESRPLRKQPLRASDDNSNGCQKYTTNMPAALCFQSTTFIFFAILQHSSVYRISTRLNVFVFITSSYSYTDISTILYRYFVFITSSYSYTDISTIFSTLILKHQWLNKEHRMLSGI